MFSSNRLGSDDIYSFKQIGEIFIREYVNTIEIRDLETKEFVPDVSVVFTDKKDKEIYLGDIIINLNKVDKKNFEREFNKLWIHGLLHLFGHNHKKNKDYVKMQNLKKIH